MTAPFDWLPGLNLLLVSTEAAALPDSAQRLLAALPCFVPGRGTIHTHFAEGVHHSLIEDAWREAESEAQDDRIVIVHTESPFAVDSAPLGAEEFARRLVVLRAGGLARLTEAQAEAFIGAHDRGIQYVHEILITNGIW